MRRPLRNLLHRLLGAGGYIIINPSVYAELQRTLAETKNGISQLQGEVGEALSHVRVLRNEIGDAQGLLTEIPRIQQQMGQTEQTLAETKGGVFQIQQEVGETLSHMVALRRKLAETRAGVSQIDAPHSASSRENEAFSENAVDRPTSDRVPATQETPSLVEALDEIRRLKIKLEEAPQIDYQAMMEHIGKQRTFATSDPDFYALYDRTKAFTMTSVERMYALYKTVEYISRAGIPGDIVECGVWRGGSMMLAALTLLKLGDVGRRLVLFDTFAGHPRPDPAEDGQSNFDEWARRRRTDESSDWAAVSLDEVRTNLQSTGYPTEKTTFIPGVVEKTIVPNRPETIALLRLDTDWYASTAHELKYLYPRLADHGGIILIDDYGDMAGARKAVDEYFKGQRAAPLLNRIDFSGVIGIKLHPVPDPP
jgi:O-methyltransferase